MNQDRYKFDVQQNVVSGMYEYKDNQWKPDQIEANQTVSYDPSTLKVTLIETQDQTQEIRVFTPFEDYYLLESDTHSALSDLLKISLPAIVDDTIHTEDVNVPIASYYYLANATAGFTLSGPESGATSGSVGDDKNKQGSDDVFPVLYSAKADDSSKASDDTKISIPTKQNDAAAGVMTVLSQQKGQGQKHDQDDVDGNGSKDDHLLGTQRDDHLSGKDGDDVMEGGHGKDRLQGGLGNDDLSGGGEDDKLYGDDGDDVLVGGDGNDLLDGGKGIDTVSYADAVGGIVVDLDKGKAHSLGVEDSSGIGHDKIRAVENIVASDHDDLLIGNRADNRLEGGLGDDVLVGGLGRDVLNGGQGNDVFKFNKVSEIGLQKHDVIEDFSAGDKIDLSAIDAKRGFGKNDSFHWLANKNDLNIDNANGAVWFDSGVLYGSTDKDFDAEFQIDLTGVASLSAADLIL